MKYAKCIVCGKNAVNGKCPVCDAPEKPKPCIDDNSPQCQICGGKRERARQIRKNGKDYGWYCYYCWHETQHKKYEGTSKSFATKEEAAYYRALEDHYLKPLFYGEKTNCEIIEQKAGASAWVLMKLEEEKDKQEKAESLLDNIK